MFHLVFACYIFEYMYFYAYVINTHLLNIFRVGMSVINWLYLINTLIEIIIYQQKKYRSSGIE